MEPFRFTDNSDEDVGAAGVGLLTTKVEEQYSGYAPCSSCGQPVWVLLPFVGCVFCPACRAGVAYIYRVEHTQEPF